MRPQQSPWMAIILAVANEKRNTMMIYWGEKGHRTKP
jgi:hypothetical protein